MQKLAKLLSVGFGFFFLFWIISVVHMHTVQCVLSYVKCQVFSATPECTSEGTETGQIFVILQRGSTDNCLLAEPKGHILMSS